MITTQDLTKRFGRVEAVRGVSLDVREGDRYGLLGPNGSGKSTLARMLLGLVYATSGSISVLGQPAPRHVGRVLPEIGAMIEEPAAYPHLSGRANLRLLDDGLDPRGIKDIRELMTGLNADGVTIFLSSHLLPEVPALCTRIGVLESGALVLQDELADLERPTGRVLVATSDPERAVAALDGLVERRDGADLVLRSTDPAALNARLVAAGVPVTSLLAQRRTLEEIVLDVTGAGSDQFGVSRAAP